MTEETTWNSATDADADTDEWREVEAEAKIIVETVGDGWQGRYMGMDDPNGNGILQAHFTGATDLNGVDIAERAFVNATRDLQNKLQKVPVKSYVRIQWVSSMNTGHESGTPMRVFKVQWK